MTDTTLISVTATELMPMVHAALDTDQPMIIEGKPGSGKSQIMAQIAAARGARFFDVRLSMWESVDLRGIPMVENGKTVWMQPAALSFDDGNETILFFDEIDRAALPTLNAALQIVLDRRIGEHTFAPSVRIMAAMNGKTDRRGTSTLPLALANRFLWAELRPDASAAIEHLTRIGANPLLVAFLDLRGADLLYTEPTDGKRFASPRQWERAARYLDMTDKATRTRMIAGLVGDLPAMECVAFVDLFSRLPRLADIIANPATAQCPGEDEPGLLYAVCNALAYRADRSNFADIMTYANRMPPEFRTILVKRSTMRDATLRDTAAFRDWAILNQDVNA